MSYARNGNVRQRAVTYAKSIAIPFPRNSTSAMFREKKLYKRKERRMKVAALYDIHGNLPALEAVLEEIEQAHFDLIVIGGDIGPGPMPKQSLHRLLDLGYRARFIRGNLERAIVAVFDGITF